MNDKSHPSPIPVSRLNYKPGHQPNTGVNNNLRLIIWSLTAGKIFLRDFILRGEVKMVLEISYCSFSHIVAGRRFLRSNFSESSRWVLKKKIINMKTTCRDVITGSTGFTKTFYCENLANVVQLCTTYLYNYITTFGVNFFFVLCVWLHGVLLLAYHTERTYNIIPTKISYDRIPNQN